MPPRQLVRKIFRMEGCDHLQERAVSRYVIENTRSCISMKLTIIAKQLQVWFEVVVPRESQGDGQCSRLVALHRRSALLYCNIRHNPNVLIQQHPMEREPRRPCADGGASELRACERGMKGKGWTTGGYAMN